MSEISTPPPARRLNTSNQTHSEPQICHQAPPTSPTRRSTLSPFTSSVFSPFRQTTHKQLSFTPQHEHSNLQVARQIPGIVMRKTCQILLAPPSHLINIMLSMAAKISAGEWKGGWMTWGGDGDVAFEVEEDREDMVDDFGFCLRKKPSSSSSLGPDTDVRRRSFRAEIPGSWETD